MGDNGSGLFDPSPGNGVSVGSSTLLPGETWTSPEGYVFSVDFADTTEAGITVNADAVDRPPSTPSSVERIGFRAGIYATWNAGSENDLAGYNLYRRLTAADNWRRVNGSAISGTSFIDTTAPSGARMQYGLTAVDQGGHESAKRRFKALRPAAQVRVDDRSAFISYQGGWSTDHGSRFGRGTVHYSATPGNKASFSFYGRHVSWYTTEGANRGRAVIRYDGVKQAKVNLQANPRRYRTIGWSGPMANRDAWHTVTVKVRGTGRVDVDTFRVS
jgi:hypothetical protein